MHGPLDSQIAKFSLQKLKILTIFGPSDVPQLVMEDFYPLIGKHGSILLMKACPKIRLRMAKIIIDLEKPNSVLI